MDYFYLKLGAGNEETELRLGKKVPDAFVFFDDHKTFENWAALWMWLSSD